MSKIKLMIMALVLTVAPMSTVEINAQELTTLPSQSTLFSISDFFSNLFNRNDVKDEEVKIKDPKATVDVANDRAKNTAYACDPAVSNCDSGTDTIDLAEVDGISIDKEMKGTTAGTGETVTDPLVPGDEVEIVLTVANTGRLDDQEVTVTDDLDLVNYITYNSTEEVVLGIIDDANTPMVIKGSKTLNDLKTGGIVVEHVDSGDEFTLTFNVKIIDTITPPTIDDKIVNSSKACKKFGNNDAIYTDYDRVHVGSDGSPDGEIIGSGAPYTLCDTDTDISFVDTDGDGTITPPFDGVNIIKSVSDKDEDRIAEPEEELTYEITVQNITTDEKLVNVKDALDRISLDNVTFKDTDPLLKDGSSTFEVDASGEYVVPVAKALTIGDLKTGFNVNLSPSEKLTFTFKGTVNKPIDKFSLESEHIINTAEVCDASGATTDCNEASAFIPATFLAGLEMQKDVDITDYSGSSATQLEYTITITNNTEVDIDTILTDILPAAGINDASANEVTFAAAVAGTVTTDPANPVVSDLTGAGVKVTIPANDVVTATFTVPLAKEVIDKTPELIAPGFNYIQNIAQICEETPAAGSVADCKSDDALTTIDGATGTDGFGIIKYVEDTVDATGATPGDGFVSQGETLKYTFVVTNNSNENNIVHITDLLNDQSIDLASSLSNALTITDPINGRFVDYKGTPISATVETLTSRDLYVEIVGNQKIEISFEVKAVDDFTGSTLIDNPSDIDNTVEACDNIGDCDEATIDIDLEGTSSIIVNKEVEDATGDNYGEAGEELTYTITILNNGNKTGTFTVTDEILDSNIDFTGTDFTQKVQENINGAGFTDSAYTLQDLNDGIVEYELDPSEEVQLQFVVKLEDTGVDLGVDGETDLPHPGIPVVNMVNVTDGTDTSTGTAIIGTLDPDGKPVDPTEGISVMKSIEDLGHGILNPANGIAEFPEDLRFTFIVSNMEDADPLVDTPKIVNIKEMLDLDPNVDYLSSLGNPLEVNSVGTTTGSMFVDPTSKMDDSLASPVEYTSYTLGDLIADDGAGNAIPTDGIYAYIPEGGSLSFSFEATTFDPYVVPASEIENIVDACYESTVSTDNVDAGTYDKCNTSIATIKTEGFEDISVKKEVVNSFDEDGTTVLEDSTVGLYAVDDGFIDYQVTISNDGSQPLQNISFSDIANSTYFVGLDASSVSVKVEEKDDKNTVVNTINNKLNVINTEIYPELPVGHRLEVTFTFKVNFDGNTSIVTGDMAPNTVQVCYDSEGLAIDTPGSVGQLCYDAGAEIPIGVDGNIPTIPDNPIFSIEKDIVGGGADSSVLVPGDSLDVTISVINNGVDELGNPSNLDQTIVLSDEFADLNLNYEDAITSSTPVNITDVSTVVGTSITPVFETFDGVTSGNAELLNLLPKDVDDGSDWDVTFVDSDAKARYSDTSIFSDAKRGGIKLTIPANHRYDVTFTINAKGSFKTIDKIRRIFDIKRYFRN